MAAVERLPVLHHIELIIFHFLWDHWANCGIFEKGVEPAHVYMYARVRKQCCKLHYCL